MTTNAKQDQRDARTCSDCRYWSRLWGGTTTGLCRISPPVITAIGNSSWPQTQDDDWCGRWTHDRRGDQPPEEPKP